LLGPIIQKSLFCLNKGIPISKLSQHLIRAQGDVFPTVSRAIPALLTKGKNMTNKKKDKAHRLTQRDIVVVKFIAEQNCVRLDTVGLLLKVLKYRVEDRQLRKLAERWVRLGLIQKQKMLADAPSILWATNEGLRIAEIALHRGERTYAPSFATLHHNLAVARVGVEYKKHGANWICERILRDELGDGHLADGLAEYGNQRILVEVDRTLKEANRLQKIMITNAKLPKIDLVDYWTTDKLLPTLETHRRALLPNIQERIRIFPLPEEVNF
jgi:hypothetical protein